MWDLIPVHGSQSCAHGKHCQTDFLVSQKDATSVEIVVLLSKHIKFLIFAPL